MIYKFSFVVILLVSTFAHSQQFNLVGRVTDSLSNPLEFANIIARPITKDVTIAFSITDERGRYRLELIKGRTYNLTVSYMGFKPYRFEVDSLSINKTKNIILKLNSEQLDEVVISYQIPVSVREDTITYRAKAFVTGEERKLKDVLKKLPGVEVDKNGLVTVRGKKITKMLVEGKEFFGGNAKLAVENIPADAVKDIVVIDNYNKVGFLKDLVENDEMAMDIKLKENKKRFVFGDVIGGGGNNKHYVAQANLFYYSPKTNLSYIGNLNDIGYKAFTFKDYLEFQGGITKAMKESRSFFNTSQSNFAEFFENPDYQSNVSKFSALNWRQTIHPKLDFSMYGLFSNNSTKRKEIALNQYLNDDVVYLTENRKNKQKNDKLYGMGKLAIAYNPNPKESIEYNLFSKLSKFDYLEFIETQTDTNSNYITTEKDDKSVMIQQDIEWHKKIEKYHTTSLSVTHEYNRDNPNTQWLSNEPILQSLLPNIESEQYQINQKKSNITHQINALFKHYWVVNNLNHLYTSIGNQYLNQSYKTNDFQVLDDGSVNSFTSVGFDNNLHFYLNDFYVGIQYKFKKGKMTFKPGLFEHFYFWKTEQETTKSHKKTLLLPDVNIKYEFKKSEKLKFKYQLKSTFSDVAKYANRFYLLNFNSVMKGNFDLENELAHFTSLQYYKFSMYRNIIINSSLSYTQKIISIRNKYQLQGINQYLVPVMTNDPETNWGFSLNLRKGFSDYYVKLKTNLFLSDYQQDINNSIINTESLSQNYGIKMGTTFDKLPNIDVGFDKRISNYVSNTFQSKYITNEVFTELNYDFLKGFILKADYRRTIFKNGDIITSNYNFLNTSLFYQKEDSPFGFEIKVTNLFDNTSKSSSGFSNFMISENQTFILPRILVFKLSYKL